MLWRLFQSRFHQDPAVSGAAGMVGEPASPWIVGLGRVGFSNYIDIFNFSAPSLDAPHATLHLETLNPLPADPY